MSPQDNMNISPSIPLPSADLINFRFDQNDKKFEEMNRKLDAILLNQSSFVPEEKVQRMIDLAVTAGIKPLRDTLSSYRNWGIAIFTAAVAVLCTVLTIMAR